MAGFPSDEAIPLDGTVGVPGHREEAAPAAGADEPALWVSVSGEAVSDSTALALTDEIGQVVRELADEPASGAEKRAPSDEDDDQIRVAVHGLRLDREAHAKLRHRIRELVRSRLAGGETGR